MPPAPGRTFASDFDLLRPLGEGGMGVVWLARERDLGRDVALKVMRPGESAARALRFAREAQALAALNHPSILPVLRTGEDSATGLRYFATPAVLLAPADIARLCDEILRCPYPRGFEPRPNDPGEGFERAQGEPGTPAKPASNAAGGGFEKPDSCQPVTLATLIDDGKALPEAAVLRLARDLSSALAAAHAAGILHRDVKPSNILFDPAGRALLADFGLAKFMEDSAAAGGSGSTAPRSLPTISLDESGARKFLGSPSYAAPESFRDGIAPSPALDWYSFGAVLYEALTGERPRSLRKPSSFDPARISRRWDAFLAALLEPDPARRLADPAAISRRLEALGRAIGPAARRRRLLGRSALCVLGVAAFLFAARYPAGPESREGGAGNAEVDSRTHGAGNAEADDRDAPEARPILRPIEPANLATIDPAHPMPPRLDSVWQGDDRGPLQLLGTFRLAPVENLVAEAISKADPETRRLLEEGDRAWSASPRDLDGANKAWFEAANHLGGRLAASAASGSDGAASASLPALPRICYATVLVRLSWSYLAAGRNGASDAPFRDALAVVDPLVESDPPRYGPFRSWLLSERAYVEAEEGRFHESAEDLRDAGLLLGIHAPLNDPGCTAQLFVLVASLGGMLHRAGDTAAALAVTARPAHELESILFPDGPGGGSGRPVPRSLVDLLAGCRYRLGELYRETGSQPESIAAYRRAADLWRDLFRAHGERYRDSCTQALGRLGRSLADAGRLEEAVAAWDEIRDLVAPVLASDPARYRPVVAPTLDNLVRAHRILGDEDRARACEAEAKRLEQP